MNKTFELPKGWSFGLPPREKKPSFSASIKIIAHDDSVIQVTVRGHLQGLSHQEITLTMSLNAR